MQDLIVVKQLPVIEQQLKNISDDIDKKINEMAKLEVNEDTVKEVKKIRTEFKKDFNELEDKRKEVKKAILTPYEQFEEIYKTYVTNKFNKADNDLKTKIDDVENKLKTEKETEIKKYFYEYSASLNISSLTFDKTNIKVGLSDSLKSLKEQAKAFVDKVSDDIKLISTEEHKEEILVEYKQSLNVSSAITNVRNRLKAIEEEKLRQEELIKVQQIETKKENEVNEIIQAPVEEKIEINEPILCLKFTVKGTRTKLQELKKFLDEGEYIYE